MKTPINSKREQFRKDIIKKQRQELFKQKRYQLINFSNHNLVDPISQLKSKGDVKSALLLILETLTSVNYFPTIMKYIDEGLIFILMTYLSQKIELQAVFEVIYELINKKQLNFYGLLYTNGLIEHIFDNFKNNLKIQSICLSILQRFTDISIDYCELILHNNKHYTIIQQFSTQIQSISSVDIITIQQSKLFKTYIYILQNLIKMQQGSINYTQQKLKIFQFILLLAQKRIQLKQTIGTLYQCVIILQKISKISNHIIPFINHILNQVKIDSNYLYNLFALIYVIINHYPISLNFTEFFKVGLMAQKVQKPFVHIILQLVNFGQEYKQKIPKNQQFWEKLFISPESKNTYCILLSLIDKLDIMKGWIWRIFAVALEQNSLDVQNEALNVIHRSLLKKGYDSDVLAYLQMNRIPKILEQLARSSKSMSLRESASKLSDYILGPMTIQNQNSI